MTGCEKIDLLVLTRREPPGAQQPTEPGLRQPLRGDRGRMRPLIRCHIRPGRSDHMISVRVDRIERVLDVHDEDSVYI